MSRDPFEYRTVDVTDEEFVASQEVYVDLAEAVRRLNRATVLTQVDPDVVRRATADVHALAAALEADLIPNNFGVVIAKSADGTGGSRIRGYGNAVVGRRNPIAAPVEIEVDREEGSASATFTLSALFEGPPGKVHGGVSALVLDQLCGEAAAAGNAPGMTGKLELRYRKPLALGECSAKAWVDARSDYKSVIKAWLKDAEGEICVEASGLFILPRWAREHLAAGQDAPEQFE